MKRRSIRKSKQVRPDNSPSMWSALAVLALALAAGGITARLEAGPRFDWLLLMTAMGLTAAVAMRLLADNAADQEAAARAAADPLQDLLASAGPMVAAIDLDGRLIYMNPAAERSLGYHAEELLDQEADAPGLANLLAPGEAERLISEVQRLSGLEKPLQSEAGGRLAALAEIVRSMPPNQVPSLDAHLKRKDDSLLPVRLQVSAMYNRKGEPTGLVAVALDLSGKERLDSPRREPRQHAHDPFENAHEMLATMDLAGRFLHVNPAWKEFFRMDQEGSADLGAFTDVFGPGCRAEAAELLHRASGGETIESAQLRTDNADGQIKDLELNLHQRRRGGKPVAVQCMARDVTQLKRRDHRLALQLLVSQIVGENVSAEMAAMRVLEALCVSQGWDVAVKWDVNHAENRLEFSTAWGVPGKEAERLIQESMGKTLAQDALLPCRAWKESQLVWISDLAVAQPDSRLKMALQHHMASGWAVPVMVGNRVLAVLEFYCHLKLREDHETAAAIETVAASLGQMLARSHERERADELGRQQQILLHSVADGICGIDRNGQVRFVNPAAARLLGAPATKLIGKPVHDLVHGAAPQGKECGEDCPLRRTTRQRVSSTGEITIFRANGRGFPAEYFMNPILDQGRFSGSVLSFRDISQRFALDRLKDEFVSTVSHELRTPLTSIRGALGLLSSGMLGDISDKATNLLRIALSNSERLVRLINDILDLERTQSGREPLTLRRVNLAEVVRQAMDGMQPVADQAGVLLIHDKTEAEAMADSDRLLQVLTNLLSNAIKFSPVNSAVSIMLRPSPTGVTIAVIDQGRGIPADKLEAIFGRFQQVDASDSRQKGGSGLGLAICRAIVMQHKGRIWAERNPVRGSTFRVFLPYDPSAIAEDMNPDGSTDASGMILVSNAGATRRPVIAEQLMRFGYRVLHASSPEQTLAAARDDLEAIVLDITEDSTDGWKLLPHILQAMPKGGTPTVLLSMAGAEDHVDPAPEANGNASRALSEAAALTELARVFRGREESARALIVEDDVELARALGRYLTKAGFTIKLAQTRREAMAEVLSFKPHMVALEVDLPDGDGFNVVDWLRQRDILPHVPVVAYSVRELTAEERRLMALSPGGLITHSRLRPEQLESLVLTMLRTSQELEEEPQDVR